MGGCRVIVRNAGRWTATGLRRCERRPCLWSDDTVDLQPIGSLESADRLICLGAGDAVNAARVVADLIELALGVACVVRVLRFQRVVESVQRGLATRLVRTHQIEFAV